MKTAENKNVPDYYKLDDIGFIGISGRPTKEDIAFTTAYFKELKNNRTEEEKREMEALNARIVAGLLKDTIEP
jgi:hypothetical protein